MKAFLLFAGSTYYPSGGWRDFVGSHDSVTDCLRAVARMDHNNDWYQIVDREGSRVIEDSRE